MRSFQGCSPCHSVETWEITVHRAIVAALDLMDRYFQKFTENKNRSTEYHKHAWPRIVESVRGANRLFGQLRQRFCMLPTAITCAWEMMKDYYTYAETIHRLHMKEEQAEAEEIARRLREFDHRLLCSSSDEEDDDYLLDQMHPMSTENMFLIPPSTASPHGHRNHGFEAK